MTIKYCNNNPEPGAYTDLSEYVHQITEDEYKTACGALDREIVPCLPTEDVFRQATGHSFSDMLGLCVHEGDEYWGNTFFVCGQKRKYGDVTYMRRPTEEDFTSIDGEYDVTHASGCVALFIYKGTFYPHSERPVPRVFGGIVRERDRAVRLIDGAFVVCARSEELSRNLPVKVAQPARHP